MATYILLTNLTDEGAKTIRKNAERIREVDHEMESLGVRLIAQYAVLGPYDFVNVVEAPDNHTIARVSAELSSRGGVRILTMTAMPIEEFIESFKPQHEAAVV